MGKLEGKTAFITSGNGGESKKWRLAAPPALGREMLVAGFKTKLR